MSYVQSPDEYQNNQRPSWADAPTERGYEAPVASAAPAIPPRYQDEVQAERISARRGRRLGRFGQIVYIALGALEALLIIRFVLKLLAANPGAAFTSFIYGLTQVFVAPFEGVFPSPRTNGSIVEVSTLLAIIVYGLIAWLIVSIIEAMITRRPESMA